MKTLSAKQIGVLLVGISIVLFFIFFSTTEELMRAADIGCRETCEPEMNLDCPHAKNIPLQSYMGFSISTVLLIAGLFLLSASKKYQEELTEKEKKMESIIADLKGEEKEICKIIRDSGGEVLQKD